MLVPEPATPSFIVLKLETFPPDDSKVKGQITAGVAAVDQGLMNPPESSFGLLPSNKFVFN